MSSKETLASGKQTLTLAGKIISGLSPVAIDSKTAQFYIDHPEAVNRRSALFAKRPTVVDVIGYRLGAARGLATLIDSWWGEKFDIFAIDTILSSHGKLIIDGSSLIHPCADIVVVDTAGLYSTVVKELEKDGRNFETKILFVNNDPDTIPIVGENVHVCKNCIEALRWVGDHQIQKITVELKHRMSEFTNR